MDQGATRAGRGGRLWVLMLVVAALATLSQHRRIRAAYVARGLGQPEEKPRDAAARSLLDLGEAGVEAAGLWLDSAKDERFREGYWSVSHAIQRRAKALAPKTRLAAARLLVANAPRDEPFNSLSGRIGCATVYGLEELGDEGVTAICEALEALLRRPGPWDDKLLVTLVLPLMKLGPRGAERVVPALQGFWQRLPRMESTGMLKGRWKSEITMALEPQLDEALCRYRGLDYGALCGNEEGAREVLINIAERQAWMRAPGGGGGSFLGLAELEAALKLAQARRPCLNPELSRLRHSRNNVNGEALAPRYHFACGAASADPEKKWWIFARPLEPGVSARYWYVLTQELKLGIYEQEPKLDRATAALPEGPRAFSEVYLRPPETFGRHQDGWGQPSPLPDKIPPPCRELSPVFDLEDDEEELEVWHSEERALEMLSKIDAAQSEWRQEGHARFASLAELTKAGLLDLDLAERGWHQGYIFECGPAGATPDKKWWAIARPIEPGLTGRLGFVLPAGPRLHIYEDGFAKVDRARAAALKEGRWAQRKYRSFDFDDEDG